MQKWRLGLKFNLVLTFEKQGPGNKLTWIQAFRPWYWPEAVWTGNGSAGWPRTHRTAICPHSAADCNYSSPFLEWQASGVLSWMEGLALAAVLAEVVAVPSSWYATINHPALVWGELLGSSVLWWQSRAGTHIANRAEEACSNSREYFVPLKPWLKDEIWRGKLKNWAFTAVRWRNDEVLSLDDHFTQLTSSSRREVELVGTFLTVPGLTTRAFGALKRSRHLHVRIRYFMNYCGSGFSCCLSMAEVRSVKL